MKRRHVSTKRRTGTVGGLSLNGVFSFAKKALQQARIVYLEALYRVHLRIRYGHDVVYQRSKLYKKYSDAPASKIVNRSIFAGFIASFLIFTFLQYVAPNIFNIAGPNRAYAGSNTKTWTNNADFSYNKTSLCGATTTSQVAILGANYSDNTCVAAATDANVGLNSAVVPRGAISIASGAYHSLALMADGTVKAWGINSKGQLGNGNTGTNSNVPVNVSGIDGLTAATRAIAVSAGDNSGNWGHSVALMADGTIKAWGYNFYGELGNGSNTDSNVPVTVSNITGAAASTRAVAIAASTINNIALMADGTVKAWGYNQEGELGNGNTTTSNIPVTVSNIDGTTAATRAIAVAGGGNSGYDHYLALMADGTIKSWGYNQYGQLGNGVTGSYSNVPVVVSNIIGTTAATRAVSLAGAGTWSLARMADGTVKSWGYGVYGALGNGGSTNSNIPVTVSNITGATPATRAIAIAAGGTGQYNNHSIALMADGTVMSWGYNGDGELGTGGTSDSSVPVVATTITGATAPVRATAISAGYYQGFALMADGTIKSWGDNGTGQLGNGTTGGYSATPVTVSNITGATAGNVAISVSAGGHDSVAVMADGTVKSWGWNGYGQLGNGNTGTDSNVPVAVSNITGSTSATRAISVASGMDFAVALMADGTVKTWGQNSNGQLGNGNTGTNSNIPVTVLTITGITAATRAVAVSAGNYTAMALMADGTIMTWGQNLKGQLGNGNTGTDRNSPVTVSNITGGTANARAIKISAGNHFDVALMADGTIKSWGWNNYGQLGNGNSGTDSNIPVTVSNITGATAATRASTVSGGGGWGYGNHAVASMADGTVKTWGANNMGQLGNGGSTNSSVPVTVSNIDGSTSALRVVSVSAGGQHTIAQISDGSVKSWGHNGRGQLGNNTTADSNVPVAISVLTGSTAATRVVAVSAGGEEYHADYSIALLANGSLSAWGSAHYGQLGNGVTDSFEYSPYTSPVAVSNIAGGMVVNSYLSPGTISGLKIDAGLGVKYKWASVSWNGTTPSNTSIKFRTRGSNVASPASMTGDASTGWTYWDNDVNGTTYNSTTGSAIVTTATRWLEVEMALGTTDGVSSPTLTDFSITYDSLEAPISDNTTTTRSDGTTKLKDSTGADINAGQVGTGGGWTSESSIKLTTTGLTCGGGASGQPACGGSSTNRKTHIQAALTSDTAFTSPIDSADSSTITSSPDGGVNYSSTATLSGLVTGSAYHLRMKTVDNEGRVSGWTSYGANAESAADITVDQAAPTGTVVVNSGSQYTSFTSASLTLSATDSGGSSLSQMRLSNDGLTWPNWESYSTSKSWTLTSGDGVKTVYVQFKDNAGNISGDWIQTSRADFDATGNSKNGVQSNVNGSITLANSVANAIVRPTGSGLYSQLAFQSPASGSHWDKVNESVADDSRYIGGFAGQKDLYAVGASGIPSNSVISSVTLNERVWSTLDCCVIGTFKFGFYDGTGEWWSGDTEGGYFDFGNVQLALANNPRTGLAWTLDQVNNLQIGISITQPGDGGYTYLSQIYASVGYQSYAASGNYSSAILDNTIPQSYGKISWSENVPSQTGTSALRFQAAANNDNSTWNYTGPGGDPGAYYSISDQLWTGLNGNRYIRYKAYIQTADTSYTPTVYDVTVGINKTTSDSVVLDTIPPSNITGLKAYSDSGKSTEIQNDTWHSVAAPYFEWTANGDSDFAAYKYCFSTDLNCSPTTSLGTTNHYTVSPNISLEGTHYFKVIATDLAGQNSLLPAVFTYKYDASAPGPVTGLAATRTDIDKVTVTWNPYSDAASPIDSYKLERVKDGGNVYQIGDTWTGHTGYAVFILSDNTPFEDTPGVSIQGQTPIDASTLYQYRISVKDTSNVDYSPYQTLKVYGMTDDLRAPDPVSVVGSASCDGTLGTVAGSSIPKCSDVQNNGFEITAVWSPGTDGGSGVAGYNIYRSNTGAVDSYVKVGSASAITNFYHDNDSTNPVDANKLNDYTTYYYRVTAFDASSHANESDILAISNPAINATSASTPDVTAPTVPANVVATPMGIDPNAPVILPADPAPRTTAIYHQRMDLTWDASTDFKARSQEVVPGTVTYKVFQASTPGGVYSQIGTTTALSYSVYQLQEFTDYFYKVAAVDASTNHNQSAQSDFATAMTASNSVPVVPTNISVTTLKGDPLDPLINNQVGKKATITYTGSYAKNCLNGIRCITAYEVYRSETNWAASADWLNSAKATKVNTNTVNNLHDDRDTTYTFVDTDLTDAVTYYYKIRALDNTPASPDGGPFTSGLSGISEGSLHQGWDITPDVTKPNLPANGLEVKVHDTHPNNVELRNLVTWKMLANDELPTRSGASDFAEYEIHREILDPVDSHVLSDVVVKHETDLTNNYYIDRVDILLQDSKFKYYVQVVDNAGSAFKYADGTAVNPGYSNKSAKDYWSDTITPSKAKPSLTAPVTVREIGVSSAIVEWGTDQDADSLVQYRVKGSNDAYVAVGQVERTTAHSVKLFGMLPSTEYEYNIVSRNYLDNNVEYDAKTLPAIKTSGFDITPSSITTTTSTTEVNWSTNLDASSAFVEYQMVKQGSDEPQSGTAGVSVESLSATPRNHKVVIKGLRSGRTYNYIIKSISKDNYLAVYPTQAQNNKTVETFVTRNFDSAQFSLAPASSNVADRNITSTTAQIVWETATETTSWVDYGTTSGVYGISSGNDNLSNTHVVTLEGLVPGTKYYYHVRVKDSNELEFTSQEYSFTAVIKPKISNMQVKNVTPYTVTIAWDTNVDTETVLNWGKTTAYGEKHGNAGNSQVHQVTIESLDDNTEYHYQIVAHDGIGNEVVGSDQIVRTPLDTEGPKITNVKLDVLPMGENDTTSSIIVSWQTNKPATTLVQYDEGVVGGTYNKSSIEDTSLNNSHTVIIKDLTPASSYHYRLVTADKRLNTTVSQDYTFVTPTKEQSILQLILKSFEDTFSWTRNINSFFVNIGKRFTGK